MLTELAVRQAIAKEGKRVEVWDEKIPGFGVRISASGVKTFVIMYYVGGNKRRLTLGRYPFMSLADARRQAIATLNQVAQGGDPHTERRTGLSPYAFVDVVDEFVRVHCARHYRSNHARETERVLRSRFVARWEGRDIRDIGRADILRVIDEAVDAGTPSAANHALAAIRKFLNWCVERGVVESNPCGRLSRPAPVNTRDRVLSDDEVAAVWTAAQELSTPFSQIVRLLLLTAQRRGEVVGMRWREIDWKEHTWTIPPSRTKNKRTQTLPLSALAIELLRSVPKLHDQFVFPARGNETATPSGFSKTKRRLDDLSGVTSWTLHDLRRTTATHMARDGTAPHVIERILNHSTGVLGGVAGIYNRFEYLPEMRLALDQWAGKFAAIPSQMPAST
jgi:integrase